jgi:amidase
MEDYSEYDAMGLAELVRNRDVKPLELVEAAITAIESTNDTLNAVITKTFERARKAAENPDSIPDGPFRGVPFLMKDILAMMEGVPMASGSRLLKGFVPDHNSELVKRIEAAGFLILGKTNTPEFGLRATTEPLAFGPTRNPWDTNHITGGSSGGSAAAVAAGMVPLAHGNDGGGSIRIPASCCGVFGMKASRGRFTLAPDYGDFLNGLVVEGCLSRTVRDSAAFYDCIAGNIQGDPYFAPPPERAYLEAITDNPPKLKVAYSMRPPLGGIVQEDCKTALHESLKLMESLGHEIIGERDILVEPAFLQDSFIPLWTAGVALNFQALAEFRGSKIKPEEVEPHTWVLGEIGNTISAADYLLAISRCQALSRKIMGMFREFDVLVTPTLAKPPVKIGELDFDPQNPLAAFLAEAEFTPFTAVCNVTGQPAVSLPLHWNENGLPIGTHIMAPNGGEGLLFQLAAQLEVAQPWKDKRPQ